MDEEQGPCWRVGTLSIYVVGGIGSVVFLFGAIMAWVSRQATAAPPLIAFVVLNVFFLVMGGTIQLTNGYIRTFTPLGSYELTWSEITAVSVTSGTLLLFAPDKQLYIPSTSFWSGKNKYQAYAFLAEKLELSQPTIVKGPRLLIFSRNCKQKRGM